MPKVWEAEFPHLGNWIETSPETGQYNCFAYAAGDMSQRWDPTPGGYYWPSSLPRNSLLETVIKVYGELGYKKCADASLHPRFEKIALYVNQYGVCEHAAQQMLDGKWTSKIGDYEDITHETLHSLSVGYGTPVYFMSRQKYSIARYLWRLLTGF